MNPLSLFTRDYIVKGNSLAAGLKIKFPGLDF